MALLLQGPAPWSIVGSPPVRLEGRTPPARTKTEADGTTIVPAHGPPSPGTTESHHPRGAGHGFAREGRDGHRPAAPPKRRRVRRNIDQLPSCIRFAVSTNSSTAPTASPISEEEARKKRAALAVLPHAGAGAACGWSSRRSASWPVKFFMALGTSGHGSCLQSPAFDAATFHFAWTNCS